MNRVFIIPQEGEIIKRNEKSGKENYGSIRLEQNSYIWNGTFLNKKKKVAFVNGLYEQLVEYIKEFNWKLDEPLDGCLYTLERTVPFYEGQSPKLNPTTMETCLIDGQLVYQQTFYDVSGEKKDEFLQGVKTKGERYESIFHDEEINLAHH